MAYHQPSFLLAVAILLYLSSFLLLAALRIATGVSIQRLGYLSLRRVSYTLKDGIRIEIRSVGLLLHRPTFAQPTWLSLLLDELHVTIDPRSLGRHDADPEHSLDGDPTPSSPPDAGRPDPTRLGRGRDPDRDRVQVEAGRSQIWKEMTRIKERIQRVHQRIRWLRLLDVIVRNATGTIQGVGEVQVGNLTGAVDLRRKFIDRTRPFHHDHPSPKSRRPAEWTFTVRSVFFKPNRKDPLEILDQCSLSVHGFLRLDLNGLHDSTISLKCGRILIPQDDFLDAAQSIQRARRRHRAPEPLGPTRPLIPIDRTKELGMSGTREERILRTVSDSKEFVSSILRGIEEVQLAMSFVRITKEIHDIQPAGQPLYLNISMKEVAMDLHRLDPRSPAHRMYFPSTDVSHQALLAGIGFSIDLVDRHRAPERLVRVPMATVTVKTTLPSKTFNSLESTSVADRNANIMFAHGVITSPSLDIDPRHLPMILALTRAKPKPRREGSPPPVRHHLISRLLPKASVKFSVHEPVVRVALPAIEHEGTGADEYDLLVSSVSSIAIDLESLHSTVAESDYSLACGLRVRSHHLYYQTVSRARYDLLMSETLELNLEVSASPNLRVLASGSVRTLSVQLVRPEISDGVGQIVQQLRLDVKTEKFETDRAHRESNALRNMPSWLVQFNLTGSNFSVEVAGVDKEVSKQTRGAALQLESWSAEYKSLKAPTNDPHPARRGLGHPSLKPEDALRDLSHVSPGPPQIQTATDGRRLTVHVHELEGFVVDSIDGWESEPFLRLPRCEVALSTSSDAQGSILHVRSFVRTLLVQYNLYRYYAIGIAATLLRTIFVGEGKQRSEKLGARDLFSTEHLPPRPSDGRNLPASPRSTPELMTLDLKAGLVQLKASLPSDPPMMLQMYALEVGNHRWTSRHFKASLIRLLTRPPKIPRVWTRITCIKDPRLDVRDVRRKSGAKLSHERSIDLSADAVRLAVPHQLVVYKVFDNIANTAKATKQLQHRFQTGTNDYILDKGPEGPRGVPKITFRTRSFLVELEDGLFERKLAMIYRVGLVEQTQRLAREAAFYAKTNRLREAEQRRVFSRPPARSAATRKMSKVGPVDAGEPHPKTNRPPGPDQPPSDPRKLRYDREGKCGLSDDASLGPTEAWERLQRLNAQSWKKRIDWGSDFQRNVMKEIRGVFWGADELPEGVHETETILEYPRRPSLMAFMIRDFSVVVDKPSFPINEYPKFLHRIGKGMPFDMQYSLLIPTSIQLEMGETRLSLRDYPIPMLHIPSLRPTRPPPRLPSWTLRTDFVIAEEFRDGESIRHVKVSVVPPSKSASDDPPGGFAVDVRRTVSPVKTYSDLNVEIHTEHPTSIVWATSYQPAIQDMMMVMETFSKPPMDPSERAGFWDKIRLAFHSRANVSWTGDGDVHLMLKGSRDPYVVTGYGAGFVMCWRNDVKWRVCQEDDPRKFMTVDSGEYVLAIPDYSHHARRGMNAERPRADTVSTNSTFRSDALFKKVIMKLAGNVQWLAGLVFERNLAGGGRAFDFRPHYKVVLKTPNFARAPEGETYDALRGFRSDNIHLSIAVAAPVNRNWSVSNLEASENRNSVHLSPRFFTHFFDWWSLFSGAMSLPIRQGPMWPGVEKTKKKFGRHLATIKYNLLLSPLFIGHIYKHKDAEDYQEDVVSATGLKMKLDSFMIDLHQRREEFSTSLKGRKSSIKTSGMRIYKAQVNFISADIRAVSASIAGTTLSDLKKASEETLASYQEPFIPIDRFRFNIPDNDTSWIDMDDFVELDWVLPAESNPETQIMPLAYAPRFTYFRQTDDKQPDSGDTTRSSVFGNESTHFCVMSPDNDPRRVQSDIVRGRLAKLKKQMDQHQRRLGEAELEVIKNASDGDTCRIQHDKLKHHGRILEQQKRHLLAMLENTPYQMEPDGHPTPPNLSHHQHDNHLDESIVDKNPESVLLTEIASDFQNRFIVHNAQIKWNNTLRNIILRYIHQVSQRRGFVYYLSRRAVKFILDIVEEQSKKASEQPTTKGPRPRTSSRPSIGETDVDLNVEERIEQLLRDAKKFVYADDPSDSEGHSGPSADRLEENVADDFTPLAAYHVKLIAPQIQLQSEKNTNAAVLVTANGMQLKVIQVMDKSRMSDDVSGLVQRRFLAEMNGVQIFVTERDSFAAQYLMLFSGDQYGTARTESWPPWVPLEIMFDFHVDPFGFSRVVQRTSVSLRYEKYNTLRLKFNEDVVNRDGPHKMPTATNAESQIDHIAVQFPQIKVVCDSSQYSTMYAMVLDLLLYNEPLEKVRSERLERIMLASDFSDLRGAPELVIRLQERIRQLEEIKMQFLVNAKYLDRQGWEDRLTIEQDLAACEDELFFMLKAITTSQRRAEDRTDTNGLLRWNFSASDVVWHLMRARNEPLIEFQLKDAVFDRTDNSDGSNFNAVGIDQFRGFNLLPDAVYPEMIAPYVEQEELDIKMPNEKMLRVYWHMLEAIAGIPVMEIFEVDLIPLRVQLEREVGKRLFEYIFPDHGSSTMSGIPENGILSLQPAQQKQAAGDTFRVFADRSGVADSQVDHEIQNVVANGGHSRSLLTRLRPTVALPERGRQPSRAEVEHLHLSPISAPHQPTEDHHSARLFQSHHQSRSSPRSSSSNLVPRTKRSAEQLKMTPIRPLGRGPTRASTVHSMASSDHSKRFSLRRSSTKDLQQDEKHPQRHQHQHQQPRPTDDLTQMVARASNYMTLAYVKIPSVVLCLSYQGRGERNLEDLHDFVFRMPAIEYRNKTWSNLDLALQLKRDVIRALISHTGALIGNKLSHHRPNNNNRQQQQQQQSRLREVANSSSMLSTTDTLALSDSSHGRESSPGGDDGGGNSRVEHGEQSLSLAGDSAASEVVSVVPRTASYASSVWSSATKGSVHGGVIGGGGPPQSLSNDPNPVLPQHPGVNVTSIVGGSEEHHHGFVHNTIGRHIINHLPSSKSKQRGGGGGSS